MVMLMLMVPEVLLNEPLMLTRSPSNTVLEGRKDPTNGWMDERMV
jgi:hypothetical protein